MLTWILLWDNGYRPSGAAVPRPFRCRPWKIKLGSSALMPPIALEQFGQSTGGLLDLLESIVHLRFQSRLDFLVCCSQSIAAAWTGSYLK